MGNNSVNFKMVSFRGTDIVQYEANILKELESIIGKEIPKLKEIESSIDLGFTIENNRISGLKLSGPKLESLLNSISNLKSLKILNLYNNDRNYEGLNSLPILITKLNSLTTLNLGWNQLTSLPQEIGNLTSLKTLYLNGNLIETLPESIGNLKSLKYLSLDKNKIISLPQSFGNLKLLEKLRINENYLKILPQTIGNLKSLNILFLNNNCLITLPESICDLEALKILSLTYNKLTVIPKSIGNLKSLVILILAHNALKELPESIGNLPNLKSLNIRDNNILKLPHSLLNLLKLEKIDLIKNFYIDYLKKPDVSQEVNIINHKIIDQTLIEKVREFYNNNVISKFQINNYFSVLQLIKQVCTSNDKMSKVIHSLPALIQVNITDVNQSFWIKIYYNLSYGKGKVKEPSTILNAKNQDLARFFLGIEKNLNRWDSILKDPWDYDLLISLIEGMRHALGKSKFNSEGVREIRLPNNIQNLIWRHSGKKVLISHKKGEFDIWREKIIFLSTTSEIHFENRTELDPEDGEYTFKPLEMLSDHLIRGLKSDDPHFKEASIEVTPFLIKAMIETIKKYNIKELEEEFLNGFILFYWKGGRILIDDLLKERKEIFGGDLMYKKIKNAVKWDSKKMEVLLSNKAFILDPESYKSLETLMKKKRKEE